jgi:hypothetical protein
VSDRDRTVCAAVEALVAAVMVPVGLAVIDPCKVFTQVAHFFAIYKQPEGIAVQVEGWRSRDEALDVIAWSRARRRESEG